ncbi:serine/threonine-protein kinase [Terracoccus luteus]|uniref:serine/threonine-protein kinase n=1 Tax=Terracoccus luteus TaxID=53356 RepID=UPI000EB3C581|nr:serine/threonine-protein kinase [Terracoccus luteus]
MTTAPHETPTRPARPRPPHVPGHRLLHVVGTGASSTVWAGEDAAGHPVAVKVPHDVPAVAPDEALERHVLMAVRHDHLVRLRDVVVLADGRVALVFDLHRGARLDSLVGRRGHLRPGEVVTVLTPVAQAVDALHAAGGVHGDVSAPNVMVGPTGRPTLLDLGAARLVGGGPGEIVGTPGFTAPEVRRGEAPGPRSDVYSLGAIAWFCVTGNGAPDPVGRLDPAVVESHVGPELAGLVAACIDPDPTRRPSAAELARLVFDCAAAEPVEVVLGDDDDASALTHRIRAHAAQDPPPAPAGPRRGRLGRLGSAFGSAPGRLGSAVGRRVLGRTGRSRFHGRPLVARVALVAAAVVLLLAVGVGLQRVLTADARPTGATEGEARPSPPPSRAPGGATSPSTGPDATAPQAGTRSGDALLTDATGPVRDPAAVVLALSTRRARALTARDPNRLATASRPRSPAWEADAAVVERLRSTRVRWSGLVPEVQSARVVGRADPDRVVVRARVSFPAYLEIDRAGVSRLRPADPGTPLDLVLLRQPEGWRVEAVSPPSAS